MIFVPIIVLLGVAFVFGGLEVAWLSLDRVRLRHRADLGNRRASQILAWDEAWPQANLVMAWTAQVAAAAALVLFASALAAHHAPFWVAPVAFIPVYVLFVHLLPRHAFRRLPFEPLARVWWVIVLAGSFWSALATPAAKLLRSVRAVPLSRPPAGRELMSVAASASGISSLELSMLRSVLDFRRLTAGELALPVGKIPSVDADCTLREALCDRRFADARHVLVLGADGLPLGAMACASAALSDAMDARAQSFARPLPSLASDLPAWKALGQLRRAPMPVAEVRNDGTGDLVGVLTEEAILARLLGKEV